VIPGNERRDPLEALLFKIRRDEWPPGAPHPEPGNEASGQPGVNYRA
jgi:hypothetical protein